MTKALEIQGLKKIYSNQFEALSGIDLEVESGDFFALLGPNGAGKSTAIGIISSLVNKTEGSVRVFGHDLDTEKEAVKRCIGLVPQEFNFNQFEKVFDIVAQQAGYYGLGRAHAAKRTEVCLRQLSLWDKRHDPSRSLSGGMKRRLMIARALVHEPRLLILDEPTAGVDLEIRRSMWAFLKQINREGTTIILTTHYLEEAESLCRHIAIINRGQIIERSSMRALLERAQTESFVLDLLQPLDEPPDLNQCEAELLDATTLLVTVKKGQSLNQMFLALERQGVGVMSLRNKENRLEQLFVDLVRQGEVRPEQVQ